MKNLLIIGTRNSFLIKGLMIRLEETGFTTNFSSTNISEFEDKAKNAEMFILYMDEDLGDDIEFLKHLADTLQRTGSMLILIGRKDERTFVSQYIPDEFIQNFYERPLDMDMLVHDMQALVTIGINEGDKKVILLVDDDAEFRQLIRGWLRSKYHVALANSGVQAITWLAKNHCDLILLDYSMPIADGKRVFEMLKSEDNTKDIPIIFLTGKNDKKSVMEIIDLKPADYLLKTISKDELLMKLSDFFNDYSGNGGGGETLFDGDDDSENDDTSDDGFDFDSEAFFKDKKFNIFDS